MKSKLYSLFLTIALLLYFSVSCFASYQSLIPDYLSSEMNSQDPTLESEQLLVKHILQNKMEELVNPKFCSEEDLRSRLQECKIIERRLNRLIDFFANKKFAKNAEMFYIFYSAIQLKKLIINYILFADNWPGEPTYQMALGVKDNCQIILKMPRLGKENQSYIYDMTKIESKKILKKWQQLGLNQPTGFIYIKVLHSNLELNAYLDKEDDNKTAGVTLPCRFIAIPWNGKNRFTTTLKHELVHACFGSIAGIKKMVEIPRWWHEGLATFVSDDLGVQLAEYRIERDQFGNLLSHSLEVYTDKEYMKFKAVFEYIRSHYGKEGLKNFIQKTKETGNANSASINTLKTNETELFAKAEKWQKKRDYINITLLLLVIFGLIYSLCNMIKGGILFIFASIALCVSFFMVYNYHYSTYYTYYLTSLIGIIILFNLSADIVAKIKIKRETKELQNGT